jgi:hypothetical protein
MSVSRKHFSLAAFQLASFYTCQAVGIGVTSLKSFVFRIRSVCLCMRCHWNVFTMAIYATRPSLLNFVTCQCSLARKYDYRGVAQQWTPGSHSTIAAFRRRVTVYFTNYLGSLWPSSSKYLHLLSNFLLFFPALANVYKWGSHMFFFSCANANV